MTEKTNLIGSMQAYKETVLGQGVTLHEIIDPKFKANELRLRLILPLSDALASASTLAVHLMTSSTADDPSPAAFAGHLERLYGASITGDTSRLGDHMIVTVAARAIDDRYALEGEKLFDELMEMLAAVMTRPHLEGSGFSPAEFAVEQRNLLDEIEAQINEKRQYALQRLRQLAYTGEPAACTLPGTKEHVLALTPESTYAACREMLRTAAVEAYFIGVEHKPGLADTLRHIFGQIPDRAPVPFIYYTPSPAKETVLRSREEMNVAQCKLAMSWKTASTDLYALRLMTLLFGGTPSSKLFANVREKMSLCYYCAASFEESKRTMTVDSGIEAQNLDKTYEAILDQLEQIKAGSFTEDEVNSALMMLHNSYRGIGDSARSYEAWYFGQLCRGREMTPAQEEAQFRAVTRAQLIAAAQSLTLDAVYIMDVQKEAALDD